MDDNASFGFVQSCGRGVFREELGISGVGIRVINWLVCLWGDGILITPKRPGYMFLHLLPSGLSP